jgi:hypothetical protein
VSELPCDKADDINPKHGMATAPGLGLGFRVRVRKACVCEFVVAPAARTGAGPRTGRTEARRAAAAERWMDTTEEPRGQNSSAEVPLTHPPTRTSQRRPG